MKNKKPKNKINKQELLDYLEERYRGIFDSQSLNNHLEDYIGFTFADQVAPTVARQVPHGSQLLDVGSGFGSFVITAHDLGLKPFGLEIAQYDAQYSLKRLEQEAPGLSNFSPFLCGSGKDLPYRNASFDAVTLWNVLEHIDFLDEMIKEVFRVLKPGGLVFIICPNYVALRMEAHYQVIWPPLLPRPLAIFYLKLLGKNPEFFKHSIFYRTNWEILASLRKHHLKIRHLDGSPIKPDKLKLSSILLEKIQNPNLISNPIARIIFQTAKFLHLQKFSELMVRSYKHFRSIPKWLSYYKQMLSLYNPFMESIVLSAQKDITP
jgi:MPBQ/MSBQ methyltransferase